MFVQGNERKLLKRKTVNIRHVILYFIESKTGPIILKIIAWIFVRKTLRLVRGNSDVA